MNPAWLRRSRVLLACLVLLVGLPAFAEDLPYAGTWKITMPNQTFDVTFWLVKIDKNVKKVSLVSGLEQYRKTKIQDIKADAKSLRFTLALGATRFQVTAQPPSEKEKDQLLGSVQIGATILPVWFQRTTLEELTQSNAIRESAGFRDLQEAIKGDAGDTRRKKIDAVIKAHPGRPVHFLALQAILGDLIRGKAAEAAFRAIIADYRKLAARHGDIFLVGAHLDLARNLMGHKPSEKVAVEVAQTAVKLLQPEHPVGLRMTAQLTLAASLAGVGKAEETTALASEIAKTADEMLKGAKTDEELLTGTQNLAAMLLASPAGPVADQGLELVRRAVKLLKPEMHVSRRAVVHRMLSRALYTRGKDDEARKLEPTMVKLEQEVDATYEKEMFSFKIEPAGKRKGSSEHIVLVELFTNAPNRQVIAATIAFDGLLRTYTSKDVVFVQYHVMFPEPDALVSPDSEARKEFYTADLEGLPSLFVDGKLMPPLGGGQQRGKNSYDIVREAITKALAVETDARITLKVTRKGDDVKATATVTGLKDPGEKTRLRFALVEERVRYEGDSGVRLHRHLVRAMPGGPGGIRLDRKDGTPTATINLAQLRKQLGAYIDAQAKKINVADPAKPLDLEKLKIIAFIQDEDSKKVYGAAQADVPAK